MIEVDQDGEYRKEAILSSVIVLFAVDAGTISE